MQLLIASRENKFSLEKRLKAKEEEILLLTDTVTAEQAKVQTYADENKNLKKSIAQKHDENVELKMFLKDLKTALAVADSNEAQKLSEIAQLTAALKAEQEKYAELQAKLASTQEGKANGVAAVKKGGKVAMTATVPEQAATATDKAVGETQRRKSFLGIF